MKKLTWEDLLPKRSVTKTDEETGYKYYYYYTDRDKFIEILRQAEAEGKVCLNPPSEKEIMDIAGENLIIPELLEGNGEILFKGFIRAISKRLRGEV